MWTSPWPVDNGKPLLSHLLLMQRPVNRVAVVAGLVVTHGPISMSPSYQGQSRPGTVLQENLVYAASHALAMTWTDHQKREATWGREVLLG